jgi:protein TonB
MNKNEYNMVRSAGLAILGCILNISASAQDAGESITREQIEQFAKFPGGSDKFYEYVSSNLKYPADALLDSITGVVYVEFALTKTGVIDKNSVRVIKSLSPSCDEEAIRLIKEGPAWQPARAKGADIAQMIQFPVSFELKKE